MSKREEDDSGEDEVFERPISVKSISQFMKKWRDRSPEEVPASRKKADDYFQAYLAADVWFDFFDPYKSVVGAAKPKFVAFNGKSLTFKRKADADRLLYLAADAAKEYLGPFSGTNLVSEDLWKEALVVAKQEVKEMRGALPLENISFTNQLGEPIEKINPDDIDALEVVRIYYQLLAHPDAPEAERRTCHQLLCLLCLREIDSALMSVIFDDAGSGISSAINASEALASAKSLRPARPPDLEYGKTKVSVSSRAEISARALEIRNTSRYAAQDWAWEEWRRIGGSQYANNKSEFARDFVIPKVKTLFKTAAGQPLEVGQKQVVEVWLKRPRIGRNES